MKDWCSRRTGLTHLASRYNVVSDDEDLLKVWLALLDLMKLRHRDHYDHLLKTDMMRTLTFPTIPLSELRRVRPDIEEVKFYGYADRGFLRLHSASARAHAPIEVAFAHIADFWWAVRSLQISERDVVA